MRSDQAGGGEGWAVGHGVVLRGEHGRSPRVGLVQIRMGGATPRGPQVASAGLPGPPGHCTGSPPGTASAQVILWQVAEHAEEGVGSGVPLFTLVQGSHPENLVRVRKARFHQSSSL